MSEFTRRQILKFLGVAGGAAALGPLVNIKARAAGIHDRAAFLGTFTPVRLPHPLNAYTQLSSFMPNGQRVPGGMAGSVLGASGDPSLGTYTIYDDVVVPPEYERYVILKWGDRVYPARPGGPLDQDYAGYNMDFTSFVSLNNAGTDGYLFVNYEYVSYPFDRFAPGTPSNLTTARGTYPIVIGRKLPASERLGEYLYNTGASILRIRKGNDGRFQVVAGDAKNRRIHGLSGLGINAERSDEYSGVTSWGSLAYQRGDNNYLVGTGPAANQVFNKSSDGLGNRIIGTSFNCAGGQTPWGTSLTAEENFQGSSAFYVGVQEFTLPDGTQTGYVEGTTGAAFGQVGEKYGWMVEADPVNPAFRPRKHTALGRFRHEGITMRVSAGRPLVAYMGDDRRGGHVWRFVSSKNVTSPTLKTNSGLFTNGTLYAAKFNADGTGRWIAITMATPVNPSLPSELGSAELAATGSIGRNGGTRLPRRSGVADQTADGASFTVDTTNEGTVIPSYQNKGGAITDRQAVLGDYYDNQGAILCDAFLAANLAGATPCARPEDFEVNPRKQREVIIAFTDGLPGSDGYSDSRIFQVAKYSDDPASTQPSGALVKIIEGNAAGDGATFRWERFIVAGEAGAENGGGFAAVDNLAFDDLGNLWGVTDMSTDLHNGFTTGAEPAETDIDHGNRATGSNLVGVFGNNWLFFIPTIGENAGEVIPFAYGPTRCEMTGPTFTGDTLIISVQHPCEDSPINDGTPASTLNRRIEMLKLNGSTFRQNRTLPRWFQRISVCSPWFVFVRVYFVNVLSVMD